MKKTFATVCSGIGAPEVAAPADWECLFSSDIEAFPNAVRAHHWPHVPNLGDMTKYNDWPDYAIRTLIGGTPCQAFSVAGLRKGLADPRGNLTLTFLGVVAKYRPRWLLWENVPGVLSDQTGAFSSLLTGLAELGYGFAYRVLDAQYFGVAQRRRRVFVVGHAAGQWQRAAAVLFERESLRGDPAPRREAGQGVAAGVKESTEERSHSLRGEGFDASEDGTGRGTPLVPEVSNPITTKPYSDNDGQENKLIPQLFRMLAFGEYSDDGSASAMKRRDYKDATDIIVGGNGRQAAMAVRRLTPRECERLQGFPDDFTLINFRNKPAADGPRYKALGNSMAVPNIRWILQRMDLIDEIAPLTNPKKQ